MGFYLISESCGLQVRRFRNVLIGRYRNRKKPYEKHEQMFQYYSHSIVAGGLDVMSYTTRFTPGTSATMRLDTRASTS